MNEPHPWETEAFNQAGESENRIHADDVARRFGFRGGLVPGVTLYAYLVHPALVSWGQEWLAHGAATLQLKKPVYDGDRVRVEPCAEGIARYHGRVLDLHGTVCATGIVELPETMASPPERRGDRPVSSSESRPDATRANLEKLRENGMGALRLEWHGRGEFDRYTRELEAMHPLVRPDRGGQAHPGFMLGLANWILASNVRLGPWIHAQSEVQNHAPLPLDSVVHVEGSIVDLFERGGHAFVDLDVRTFLDPDIPLLSARHRAIYRLRAKD